MVKQYSKVVLEVDPEVAEDFNKERLRLNIPKRILFLRMWDLWQTMSREKKVEKI